VRNSITPMPHGSDGCRSLLGSSPPCWDAATSRVQLSTEVLAQHSDERPAPAAIWAAYIVKEKKTTQAVCASTSRRQPEPMAAGNQVSRPCFDHHLAEDPLGSTYRAPFGRLATPPRWCAGFPLRKARTARSRHALGGRGKLGSVLPVPNHLLGVLGRSKPEVLRPLCRRSCSGRDILTIGETPLAVMQAVLQPFPPWSSPSGWPGCSAAPSNPTSSLATACVLQTLDRRQSVQPRCSWPGWRWC